MHLDISLQALRALVARQLRNLFLLEEAEEPVLFAALDVALKRCEACFEKTPYKNYQAEDGKARFNPFHSSQYAVFLYYLSNSLIRGWPEHRSLADRVYFLNKTLNSVEIYHEVELPAIFMLEHPIGSVMGRATYNDHFAFAQNCTVGNNKGFYPTIGRHVKMLAGAQLLGKCVVGDHVLLAANTYVIDTDIPSCSIVFGSSPNLVFKQRPAKFFEDFV